MLFVTQKFRQFRKALKLVKVPIYRRGLSMGVAASIENESLMKCIRPRTVVDIGANIGQFSLLVRHHHPDAKIIAFEPLNVAAKKYRRLFDSDPNTVLHQAAIGPSNTLATMNVAHRHDSSSLLETSDLQTTIFPGTEAECVENVRVGTLDTFIGSKDIIGPALLKMDVQGFEYEALSGCESLLKNFNTLYIEASFVELYVGQHLVHEIIDYLSRRRFNLKGIYNVSYQGAAIPVQADLLFQAAFPD